MDKLTTSTDIGLFLATADKVAGKIALEIGTFHYYDTDGEKLAATGLVPGDIAVIQDEGNRIEQYTGGSISSQSNWAVLRNTVFLTIFNNSYSFFDFNGIYCNAGYTTIGWVCPDELSYTPPTFTTLGVSQLYSGDVYISSPFGVYVFLLPSFASSNFHIPYNLIPRRSASLTVVDYSSP